MKHKIVLGLFLSALSSSVFAANEGKITSIAFAGANMSSHPDVVQLQIEGGFESADCNTGVAAIRKSDTHLVSAALAAFAMGKPVKVFLNAHDLYFPSQKRCVISMLTMAK
ncbi:hypothetical protein [Pseudoalteromonas rubra]|uniref:hypothetical protein n=1 Tax=Pseudoalteromonas rubra TaxID=43658 RepID=UPI002DBAD2DA|nr:hypothetical protein [Pseudoalteromonas rubra]MEC4088060.1 hypothetical protein [Pseudoalteromonas rubra]